MNPINRLAELIEDWKYLIRRDGLQCALPVIGIEIARLPYRHIHFLILVRSLNEPLPNLHAKIPLEIRPLEGADLVGVREIDRPSEANLCARRLENGQIGLVALYQGRLIGYAWSCPEVNNRLERVPLKLEPGDILCTDVFTRTDYRGLGVQTALTLRRFQISRDLGYQRAISYIGIHNSPSLAVWERKFGSQIAGRIEFIRLGSRYRVRCKWNDSPVFRIPEEAYK